VSNKRGSVRLTTQLEAILSAIEILPLEEPSDHRYAELRTSLESRGTPIGPNNMLIAAHALALDCIVITANVGEFSRAPGLRVENWLETNKPLAQIVKFFLLHKCDQLTR
jgi:tRNA(fMet)-specific endonuclease VapC